MYYRYHTRYCFILCLLGTHRTVAVFGISVFIFIVATGVFEFATIVWYQEVVALTCSSVEIRHCPCVCVLCVPVPAGLFTAGYNSTDLC